MIRLLCDKTRYKMTNKAGDTFSFLRFFPLVTCSNNPSLHISPIPLCIVHSLPRSRSLSFNFSISSSFHFLSLRHMVSLSLFSSITPFFATPSLFQSILRFLSVLSFLPFCTPLFHFFNSFLILYIHYFFLFIPYLVLPFPSFFPPQTFPLVP